MTRPSDKPAGRADICQFFLLTDFSTIMAWLNPKVESKLSKKTNIASYAEEKFSGEVFSTDGYRQNLAMRYLQ